MKSEKTNHISIYLLKKDKEPSNSLTNKNFTTLNLENGHIFYYDKSNSYRPPWIKNFFDDQIDNLPIFNQSSKGLLFCKSKNEWFAIPFGYGHTMLDKYSCVDDFGLKIVLNLVDKDSIRKIGKRTLSSEPKNTIEQLSKVGSISDFGLDIEQDIVEEITGKPNDPDFGNNLVTGKIAFTVSTKVNITSIESLLKKCHDYYRKDTYKKHFAFIDQVKEIRIADDWNQLLIDQLNGNKNGNVKVWMAIPEIIIWDDVAGFSYSGKNENLFDDITLNNFKESLSNQRKDNLSIDFLKNKKVFCFKNSSSEKSYQWSYYQCMYCEISKDDRKILLTNGKWYEVAKDFVAEVEKSYQLSLKNAAQKVLLECDTKDHEDVYNKKLAKSIGGILMDRKNISYGGGSSSVEFCDVYDQSNKSFIHIKNYYGSSALSHLFAQGKVSAQLFLSDPKFRKKVTQKEPSLQFDKINSPKPNDYKIVFGIISKSRNELDIPFFSKVNFKNEYRLLRTFGFKQIQLIKIQRK